MTAQDVPTPMNGKKIGRPQDPIDVNSIPEYMKALPQWLGWKWELKPGAKKPTKPPKKVYRDSHGELQYCAGKSNDPQTWTDFDTVLEAVKSGLTDGIGFAFWETDRLAVIDLDHILDLETKAPTTPEAAEIIQEMRNENTFIEYSPSGDGVHGWFFGKPVHCGAGSVNKWIEPYAHPSHRFMTVTGVPFNGQTDIGEGQGFLDWLHVKFKTAPSAAKGVAAGAKTYSSDDTSSETVQEWLTFIDPDGRENWVKVGMALKDSGKADAFAMWDEWSKRSPKYNAGDMQGRWSGFKGAGTTLGSVHYLAEIGGWKPKQKSKRGSNTVSKELDEALIQAIEAGKTDSEILASMKGSATAPSSIINKLKTFRKVYSSIILAAEEETFAEDDIDAAAQLLKRPNLFAEFYKDFQLTGYKAARSLTDGGLLLLSRTLTLSSSCEYGHGSPSSGKSVFYTNVVGFYPTHLVHSLTDITARYLYRAGGADGKALSGKILLFGEMMPSKDGEDDEKQKAIRQFVSENKLELGSVDDVGGQRNVATRHIVYGPVHIVFTGIRSPSYWDNQIISRATCREFRHDQTTISQVLKSKATSGLISSNPLAFNGNKLAAAQRKWRAAFSLLKRLDPDDSKQFSGIEIPFLEALIPKKNYVDSDMRSFEILKSCIASSAMLHQQGRETKKEGDRTVLVAKWDDYTNIRSAFQDSAPRATQVISNDLIDKFINKLLPWWESSEAEKSADDKDKPRTKGEIAEGMNEPIPSCSRWLFSWVGVDLLKLLRNESDPNDRKNYYKLADDYPERLERIKQSGDLGLPEDTDQPPEIELTDHDQSMISRDQSRSVTDRSGDQSRPITTDHAGGRSVESTDSAAISPSESVIPYLNGISCTADDDLTEVVL